jgi:hypothetical protein
MQQDPTLDGRLPAGSVLNLETQVLAAQAREGSACHLLVTVTYFTLTYDNV